MLPLRHFFIPLAAFFVSLSLLSEAASNESETSIYEVLNLYGLPTGLLPKGISNFSYDDSGKFEVHLDQACYAKFESELRYDMNVTGTLSYGMINELSGISAQDLFLWFSVIEIRVDVPSSGLIYFDVGVVSKQFSLSSFETPRDCLPVLAPDLEETVSKNVGGAKTRVEHDGNIVEVRGGQQLNHIGVSSVVFGSWVMMLRLHWGEELKITTPASNK